MADEYWDRLTAAYTELMTCADHPWNRAADPELMARLLTSTEREAAYLPPTVEVHGRTIDSESGSIPARIYVPEAAATSRPLFVWSHGGAWAAGGLDMPEADATAREICAQAGAVVVSVDYRLAASGVHFPVPHDDVVTAYLWAVTHAETLGADPARITLGGASAGANLAAGAALRVRDDGKPMPAALLLAYPCLHPEPQPASVELRSKLDRLSPAAACAPGVLTPIVENYLGAPVTDASPYAMPGVSHDLTELPPTLIINCEYDGLRASGERFAEQLKQAGVRGVVTTVPDVAHGHLERPGLPQAAQSHTDMATWAMTHELPIQSAVIQPDQH